MIEAIYSRLKLFHLQNNSHRTLAGSLCGLARERRYYVSKKFDATSQDAKFVAKKRRRVRICCYISNAAGEFVRCPWKLIFLLPLLLGFGFAYSKREQIPLPENIIGNPQVKELYIFVYVLVLVTITILLLLGLMYKLGTPSDAKDTEFSLTHIEFVDRYGFSPILVSRRRIAKSNAERLTFYSKGISKETWMLHRGDIEDILNVHCVGEDPIQYSNRRFHAKNYIVLTVAPGVERKREEPLYDDEI